MDNRIVFRMSSAGECPRALSAKYLSYEPEPAPQWLETAANEGKMHEEWIVNWIESDQFKSSNEGYSTVYDRQLEITLSYPRFDLLGHIDGKYCDRMLGSGDYTASALLEIKTMSQFEFDRWMRGRFDEFPQYADQLTCHMEATGLKEALYIVKNRSSGYIDRRVITEQPSNIVGIIHKLGQVEQAVTKQELIEVEADFSTFQCKRCAYKTVCVKSKDDMVIQDEKVLFEACKQWRAGDKKEKEGKHLSDTAKKVFEEQTIASGVTKWQFDGLAIGEISVKEHERPAVIVQKHSYIKVSDLRREE